MITRIKNEIEKISTRPLFIAIDGRCASGKTTLANQLQQCLDSAIIHMDHFFLRPHQRTPERLETPGGNIDYERFLEEVLKNLVTNTPFSYRPYNCKTQQLDPPIKVPQKPITIIEGTYSCHPSLINYYHIKIFLTVDQETQIQRIKARNGEQMLKTFQQKWIPLEEKYFQSFNS